MKHEKVCLIGFNTQNTVLVDVTFEQSHLQKVNRIIVEGALYTGDKITVQFDMDKRDLVGVFNWECNIEDVKHLYILPAFGGIRIGLLTIYYEGEDEDKLKSKAVGASVALPVELINRM